MLLQLSLAALLLLLVAGYVALIILSPTPPITQASETTYRTTTTSPPLQLPTLSFPATCELTVVIPAYNEKERIGIMLKEAIDYLEDLPLEKEGDNDASLLIPKGVRRGSYELLVVDDGSKDGTSDIVLGLFEKYRKERGGKLRGEFRVVTLKRNRGKGGCVKHGILHSSGHRILFADADGASHFPDLALLQDEMDRLVASQANPVEAHGVVVGSRAHLVKTEAVVKRSLLRNLLMRGFHTYLYVLGIRHIRDTQCGFKLQTRPSALVIYPNLHSPSWIFDCEILLLATLSGIPTKEVGIKWQEVSGSKVDLIKDSLGMAKDLLVIRGNYLVGRWKKPTWVGGEVEGARNGHEVGVEKEEKKSK